MNPDDPAGTVAPVDLDYVRGRVAECVTVLSAAVAEKAARLRRPIVAAPAQPRPCHLPDALLLARYEAIMREHGRFSAAAAVRVGLLRRKLGSASPEN